MSDEPDYSSLSLNERLVHKVWKVRLGAYEEILKSFQTSPNEESECFHPFLQRPDIFKKIVTDSNVVAQEAGISSLIAFLEFGGPKCSIKLRSTVVGPLVEKGLASSRAGTKSKSIEALLWFIELDTPDPVIEDMLPFLGNRLPKLVAATTKAFTEIYSQFGAKTVSPKLILPSIPKLFSHADKTVRAETTALSTVLFKWMGPAFEQIIFAELKPVQQKDLTAEFEKVKDEKVSQTRLLRSQQQEASTSADDNEDNDNDVEMANGSDEPLDAYDMIEPVDVLSKLPADLHTRIGSSKWKDRKEVLEEVHKVLNVMKIINADYVELVRMLAKCLKDANIQVVQLAANCIEYLAKGLRSAFSKYVPIVLGPMVERTKEKKASVSEALENGLDALFSCSSFSDILEETIINMKHKTPQVKIGATNFLTRCLKETKVAPSKPEIEQIMESGMKLLSESQEPVRAAASEAIGTLMKITGERELIAYMEKVDENRKGKVMAFHEKAEVKAKARAPKPVAPVSAKQVSRAPSSKPASSQASAGLTKQSSLKKPKTVTGALVPAKRGASSPMKRPEEMAQKQASILASRNGLTGRSLASNSQIQSAPKFAMPMKSADAEELEQLRLQKQTWLKEKENMLWQQKEFNAEKARLMEEINSLQIKNDKFMDEHTSSLLQLKQKDTQISRITLDLESSKHRVYDLEREVELLRKQPVKHTLSSSTSENKASNDQFIRPDSRNVYTPVKTSPYNSPYDSPHINKRFTVDLSSRVSGLSIENNNPYEQKENRYSQMEYGNSYTSNLNKETLELDTNDDSWRRAAEVTSQLKARIEKMKARSRSSMAFP